MAVTQKTAVNFSIDQGADFSKNFTVTTDGSTAYDISGLTLQSQIRKSYDSSSATATLAPNEAAIRLARTPPDPAPITNRS